MPKRSNAIMICDDVSDVILVMYVGKRAMIFVCWRIYTLVQITVCTAVICLNSLALML